VTAQEALIEEFDTDSANVLLLVSAQQGTVDRGEVADEGRRLPVSWRTK